MFGPEFGSDIFGSSSMNSSCVILFGLELA